jgi:hypothetical protein
MIRIRVLTTVHVPDDGSAEPKHSLLVLPRGNVVVYKKYICSMVCLRVFIITVIEKHWDDPN